MTALQKPEKQTLFFSLLEMLGHKRVINEENPSTSRHLSGLRTPYCTDRMQPPGEKTLQTRQTLLFLRADRQHGFPPCSSPARLPSLPRGASGSSEKHDVNGSAHFLGLLNPTPSPKWFLLKSSHDSQGLVTPCTFSYIVASTDPQMEGSFRRVGSLFS